MSEKTVHWPGSNGSPGLDFSDPSSEPDGDATVVDETAQGGPQHAADSFNDQASGADRGSDPEHSWRTDAEEEASAWAWQPITPEPADEPTTEVPTPGESIAGAARAGLIGGAVGGFGGAPSRAATPAPTVASRSAAGARRTRKARLRLSRIDPWSVMKTAFLFSIAFGIMMMVIVWVLWSVLAASGVLESLNQFLVTLIGDQDGARFDVTDWINGPRVLGLTAVMSAISVVILTAVTTLFAFLYNLAASVIGGLEVTLAED